MRALVSIDGYQIVVNIIKAEECDNNELLLRTEGKLKNLSVNCVCNQNLRETLMRLLLQNNVDLTMYSAKWLGN